MAADEPNGAEMTDEHNFPPKPQATAESLADPLGFMEVEHAWHDAVTRWIEAVLDGLENRPIQAEAEVMVEFLTRDLPRHIQDEEEDLFPLLKERCGNDSSTKAVISRLSEEHKLDEDLVDFIIADLQMIAANKRVPNLMRFFANASGFAENQRRHLAWENQTVLPLARKSLTEADVKTLARGMAERRGLSVE